MDKIDNIGVDSKTFDLWQRDSLVRFCNNCYAALRAELENNQHLRRELAAARDALGEGGGGEYGADR